MINQYSTSKQEQQQRKLVRANPFEPTEVDCQDTTKRFNVMLREFPIFSQVRDESQPTNKHLLGVSTIL